MTQAVRSTRGHPGHSDKQVEDNRGKRSDEERHHGSFAEGEAHPAKYPEDEQVGTLAEGEADPAEHPEDEPVGTFAEGEKDEYRAAAAPRRRASKDRRGSNVIGGEHPAAHRRQRIRRPCSRVRARPGQTETGSSLAHWPEGRCSANSSAIHERHVERAVAGRVQRCLRCVLCRNLPSMMRRARERCGPLVVVMCDGSHGTRRQARDRTPPQGLHDVLLRRALRRDTSPRRRSSDDR